MQASEHSGHSPHTGEPQPTPWPGLTDEAHSRDYVERFREMAAHGQDLQGEARLVDALAPRGARLLDAGCGPGRHGGYLVGLGHHVVGADIDPLLIEAARADHPAATWLVSDLSELDLAAHGEAEPFDGAFIVGNVMDFVSPPVRTRVLERMDAHLRPDGFLMIGCRTGRDFGSADLDEAASGTALVLEQRFATYDLRPWRPDATFCVSVLRKSEN